MRARTLGFTLFCLTASFAGAQDTTSAAPLLNVFLDCQTGGCDFDFFRTEFTVVNWVRDRQVADVHLLVTSQQTGAGGSEYTVTFLGLRQFAGVTDTLKYVSPPAASDDDRRRGLARVFKSGLVRYLARTPAADRMTIAFTESKTDKGQTTAKTDRWNYWVFRTSVNGWTNGEERSRSFNTWGNVNANRVTERWKTQLSVESNYSQDDFELDDSTTFTNIRRGYGGSVLQVKSLGQHWSAGLRANLSSSTFDNFKRAVRILPAIEYNVFPYSQSTRRLLRFEYSVGIADFVYHDTTIFDKLAERLPMHRLNASITSREPWGSIDVGITGTGYLNDPSKYRIGSFGDVSLRLFRGFDLGVFGGYDIIRDQFGLAKRDFTPEEILTRQFRLGSRYSYFGSFRLSYTFGSIYNNVVNPRMRGGFFD